MKPIDVFIVFVIAFAAGGFLGHLQEQRWSQIKQDALVKQVERQQCSDVNPWK